MKQSVKRMISSVIALLLIVGAFTVFVYEVEPAYNEIAVIQANLQAQETLFAKQEEIIQKVQKITGTYEQGARAREEMAQILPNDSEVATALYQIGGIAQVRNLTARSFAVSFPAAPSAAKTKTISTGSDAQKKLVAERPIGTMTIRVELVGSYENFKAFLSNIETNIRLFDVKNITIQPIGKSNEDLYSYSVTVAAYYQQ